MVLEDRVPGNHAWTHNLIAMSDFDSTEYTCAVNELQAEYDSQADAYAETIKNERVKFAFLKRRIPFEKERTYVGFGATYTEAILCAWKDIHNDAQHAVLGKSEQCPICQLAEHYQVTNWAAVLKCVEVVHSNVEVSEGNLFQMHNEF